MPRIPDYRAQVVPAPSVAGAAISEQAAAAPWLAMSEAAGKAEKSAVMLASHLYEADRAVQVSQGIADASIAINDLRNKFLDSPEFNFKPEETFPAYKEQLEKLRDGIAAKLPDNATKNVFVEQFNKLSGSHLVAFANDARKVKINLIQAGTLRAIDGLTQAAARAPDEETFKNNMGNIYGSIAGAIASGAFQADQGEQLRQHAVRAALRSRAELGLVVNPAQVESDLSNRQGIYKDLPELDRANLSIQAEHRKKYLENAGKTQAEENAVNNAYFQSVQLYGLNGPAPDYQGALSFVQDPANWSTIGITDTKQMAHVQTLITAQWNQQYNMSQQAIKQKNESFNQSALQKFSEGKLAVGDVLKADIDASTKEHWYNAIGVQGRREERPNPELYSQTLARIWTGEIKDVTQLIPLMGPGGISGTQAQNLKHSIDQAVEPSKSQYFKFAVDMFKAKHKNDPEMLKLLPEFENNLDWHIKSENLKGADIYEKGKQLMTPIEENRWWKFWQTEATTTPPFKREIDEQPWMSVPPAGGGIAQGSIREAMKEKVKELKAQGISEEELRRELLDRGIDPAEFMQ